MLKNLFFSHFTEGVKNIVNFVGFLNIPVKKVISGI